MINLALSCLPMADPVINNLQDIFFQFYASACGLNSTLLKPEKKIKCSSKFITKNLIWLGRRRKCYIECHKITLLLLFYAFLQSP